MLSVSERNRRPQLISVHGHAPTAVVSVIGLTEDVVVVVGDRVVVGSAAVDEHAVRRTAIEHETASVHRRACLARDDGTMCYDARDHRHLAVLTAASSDSLPFGLPILWRHEGHLRPGGRSDEAPLRRQQV